MRLHSIVDEIWKPEIAPLEDLQHFDAAFFCAGYERRCSYIAEKSLAWTIDRAIVLEFETFCEDGSRQESDEFFADDSDKMVFERYPARRKVVASLFREILESDAVVGGSESEPIRILVDYTSMSRELYAAVLSLLRFTNCTRDLEVSFLYAAGSYGESLPQMRIDSIQAIPGFDGTMAASPKSFCVFDLGYDEWAPFAVHDRIEGDSILAVISDPGVSDDSARLSQSLNREFLRYCANFTELFPALSVASFFSFLASKFVENTMDGSEFIMVGLGPKPHVLAMILLAIRFPDVAVIQAQGELVAPVDVSANGKVLISTVRFISETSLET